jgi:RNA polymerase sigma-70 factor (ECF subfamily)
MEKLIQNFRLNNQAVFKSLHDMFFRRVWFFANRLTGDLMVAEDIATESFIKLWDNRDNFTNLAQVRGFLFTSTKNACLNHLKLSRRHEEIHSEIGYLAGSTEDTIEYNLIRTELVQLVYREIERLPPVSRQVCSLILKDRLSRREVAEQLKLTPQTIDTHINRAVKRIKVALIRKKIIFLLALLFRLLS